MGLLPPLLAGLSLVSAVAHSSNRSVLSDLDQISLRAITHHRFQRDKYLGLEVKLLNNMLGNVCMLK